MNKTNRGLNRVLLAIIALVLLAAGAAVAATGFWPTASQKWREVGDAATSFMGGGVRELTVSVGDLQLAWVYYAITAGLVILAILMVAWIASQGGGSAREIARQESDGGTTVIRPNLAAELLSSAFADDPRVLSTAVSAGESRKSKNLKFTIQVRRGVSPRPVLDAAAQVVQALDGILGQPVPVLVSIQAGPRAALSHRFRVN